MKYFLNILALLTVLMVAFPSEAQASCCSEAQASCCSTESTCQSASSEEGHQDNKPCGSSSCDCICCGSVSLLLIKKTVLKQEPLAEIHPLIFQYSSLHGASFSSTIWQPPRLR